MDWTDFAKDKQSTLMLSLATSHGQSTPLLWKTVSTTDIKGKKRQYEEQLLRQLRDWVSPEIQVIILANRGFADQDLFLFMQELGFDYVIRFRQNIWVSDATGTAKLANQWLGSNNRAKTLRQAFWSQQAFPVATVVCFQAAKMKSAWCIVSSLTDVSGRELVNDYAKRWSIEPLFRDIKDIHYGFPIRSTQRRD